MDHFYQVNHTSALNHPKDGLPSTQSSNDALRQMGSEGKTRAVHEEMKRVSRLPPSSAYATHRMRVLNKILQLLSIQVHGAYIQTFPALPTPPHTLTKKKGLSGLC
ncbi:hypothetical protein T459_08730 [Capsicum annuum]|uniref:Uncharacterized protein n=1 Tax=Capsicum annuum TaxID=4072 RepID=A0A2G2ZXC8_CAPAN|nr:hypothetical protein T459_08730 [Capsicum annuum]